MEFGDLFARVLCGLGELRLNVLATLPEPLHAVDLLERLAAV